MWYLRADNKDLLREVRFLKQDFSFEPLIIMYDDTILIISSKKENFALVVRSGELSNAMKILFDSVWEYGSEKATS